jgi:hypothetical protein
MEKQTLRGQLEELDAELKRTESIDEGEREALRRLEGDIREILAREGDHPQEYEGLGERLRETVAQLEASHPAVTMRMRQVIDQLSFMGI